MGKVAGRHLSVALIVLLVSNLFAGMGIPSARAAAPEQYTVLPVQDNYVRKTNPSSPTPDYSNQINGGETAKPGYLNVKETSTTSPREAYLQFDLANYPEHITSAVLYLYGRNDENNTATVTTRVYGVDIPNADNWTESTLTWNTKPGPGNTPIGSLTFPGKSTPGWQSLDVTSFIRSQLSGDKRATFALAGGSALLRVEARTTAIEDVPGHKAKPYLVINGTPALKTVSLTADRMSLGIGETAHLSVTGMLDTNTAANLAGAAFTYTSDSPSMVVDDPSTGVVRAVSGGTAVITASVTLEGVTRTSSVLLSADGTPPAEVTYPAAGLVNGEYTLTWTDPADADYSSVRIYNGAELIGTVSRGVQRIQVTGLTAGSTYTFTWKTVDAAGNVSPGAAYTAVYTEPNVLKEILLSADKEVLKPGESIAFTVQGTMKDGTPADLSHATVSYSSSGGGLVFGGAGIGVAQAVYAGPFQVRVSATMDGVTRDSAPVPVRVYPAAQDEYDALRIKYVQKLTGYNPDDPYDPDDPDIRLIISTQDADAKSYWDTMNKNTYSWPDLISTTKSGELATASSRLRTMSKQWATYGSAYYQNEAMLHDILEGWNQFYTARYNETKSMYDNWFDWLVNVPNNINDSMIFLYETISHSPYPDLVGKLNRAIDKNNPTVTRTGANRVYISKVLMLRGITGKDGAKIRMGSDGLNEVFPNVKAGDGFYDDGSFIQHDYFPYAGGYGKALLSDISETLWLVSGSTWDNTDPRKSNIFDWYFQAFEPNLYKGQIINAIDGREISRDYSFGGFAIVNALLLQVEMAGNPYTDRLKSAIKYHIEEASTNAYLSTATIWNMQKAKQILGDSSVEPYSPPQGNFSFYNQDNVVHRGADWLYSISMHSDRMANYETVNNENLKGWYEADGMTQLYLDPLDYLSLFWITADPSRLPGITVDRDVNRPASSTANRPYVDVSKFQGDGELMSTSWTGGVSLDRQYGTAGMDFKQHHYSDMDVSAKKSWFLFDDEIVALGAGINSSSGRPIETIVENRTLNSAGDNALTVDGALNAAPMGQETGLNGAGWAHLDGTGGYVFPGGADLRMLREERSGKSKDINERFIISGNDEFNSTTRSSYWGWIREDKTHYAFTGSRLSISTQPGTLKGPANSTANLFQTATPKEDFYVTTAVDFTPSAAGHEAGILIRRDDDNYVYLAKGMTSQGIGILAVSEAGGVEETREFPLAVTGDVFLKIDKSGDRYTVYASGSESDWGAPLGTFINPMAGADRLNTGLKMGLFAQGGTGPASEAAAGFDFFHLWHTRNYMTLWFDHGVQPQDAAYSYIQLPKKTSGEVAAYSAHPDVTIVANTKEVQAAKDTRLGITGMNFWQRGILGMVKANHASSLMMKESGNSLQLAVSDPTHKQGSISFEIKKKGTGVLRADSTVHVIRLFPTIQFVVDTSVELGKTHNVVFTYDAAAAEPEFAAPSLASASFDTEFAVVKAGESLSPVLTARMDDAGAADLTGAEIVYYSSNDLTAAVDSSGTVTGAGAGTARITAAVTLGGVTRAAVLQVLVPSAQPAVVTLSPVKDTFVRSGVYDKDVYGADTKLNVKNAGGDDYREAYFTFDLSGITGDIESVKLYATGKLDDSSGTFVDTVLKPVLGSWEEGSARYSTKPALGRAVTGPVRFTNVEAEKAFDVTAYAREQLQNGTALDLALVQEVLVGRKLYVYSKENAVKKPYLVVITHPSGSVSANASVTPATAVFDRYAEGPDHKDITVNAVFNGNGWLAIRNGTTALVEGTDFTVSGNRFTLKKEYLAAQPAGALRLTFDFSGGLDPVVVVTVADSTPDGGGGNDGGSGGNGGGNGGGGTGGEPEGPASGQPGNLPGGQPGTEPGGQPAGTSNGQPHGNPPGSSPTLVLVKVAGGVKVTGTAAVETQADGSKSSKMEVPDAALQQALDMISGKSHPTITIHAEASEGPLTAVLPAGPVLRAAKSAPDAFLYIEAGAVGYRLPVQAVQLESLAQSLGAALEDMQLAITLGPVSGLQKKTMEEKAAQSGIRLAGSPVDFSVHVEANGKSLSIRDFGTTFVARTVSVPAELDPDRATALLYDPLTERWSFVPAAFTVGHGQTTATIIRNGNSIYTIAERPKTFSDLSGHWAKQEVERMASKMLVNGVSGTDFAPERAITRAEFTALLVRGLGLAEQASAARFSDVSEGDWFAGPVGAAVKAGLVQGLNDGAFHPDELLTRQEMAVMVIRAVQATGIGLKPAAQADQNPARFRDQGAIAGWAQSAVAEAVEAGILHGVTETTFEPQAQATRAQAAVMLLRMLQKLGWMN
ncbi:polysaccharide lyase family 8 super-sandwich domain-containing protein [Gorillibacterium sp. sgz5001074]|uniref:polysaccharide lyase family 8 super-sandwich domain-containing protein n=1 Tax=Gorillibacterium sp. sgz5001074 TaxID=3446695 RepID=UPI003F676496